MTNEITLKVKLLTEYEISKPPTKSHVNDAGFDLYASADVVVYPNRITKVPLGLCLGIPSGWVFVLKGRSGLALNEGIEVLAGVIDSGYTGPVAAVLMKSCGPPYPIKAGDKIVQGLLLPVPKTTVTVVDSLEETERGDGGFGSTNSTDK